MVNNEWMIKDPARVGPEPGEIGSDQGSKTSISQIVVPTDLTRHGRKAVGCALAIARCFNANLTLIHIYDPAYTYAEAAEVITKLERLCSEVRKEHPASEFTVGVGAPYLQIPALAKDLQADLMVISTHNFSWLEKFIFGSETGQIVRRTPCPVLIVRDDELSLGES